MPYISGFDRNQLMCCSWDAFVDEESIARIIDAFVEHLDMKKYGVKAVTVEGRPSYDLNYSQVSRHKKVKNFKE